MRLLGIDIESTGLDVQKDRILKLGAVLYSPGLKVPLVEKEWTLYHYTYPEIKPDAFLAHGLSREVCDEFGENPKNIFLNFAIWAEKHKITHLVAHNGHNFDFPMLLSSIEAFEPAAGSFFRAVKKIDTSTDLPYPDQIQTRKLAHLAAEHGFINPFPHSTLSDIRTMFEIFFRYPIDKILERAESKTLTIQALVQFETKELAKLRRYQWDAPNQRWLKKIKECDLEKEKKDAPFQIKQI